MFEAVCIGGACIDRKYRLLHDAQPGTSNPAHVSRGFGGVARNVAENLARLGVRTALVSAVGNDESGAALLAHARSASIDVSLVLHASGFATPEYSAIVHRSGDLFAGVSDMRAVDAVRVAALEKHWDVLAQSRWIFADCNLQPEVLAWCIERARSSGVKLAIDAVSEPKVRRLPSNLSGIDLLVLNEGEAAVYLGEADARMLQKRGAAAVVLTRGERGLIAAGDRAVEIPALRAKCVDVTGAGDALVAAILYRLMRGGDIVDAARIGSLCAGLTVESAASVRPDLSPKLLAENETRLEPCIAS